MLGNLVTNALKYGGGCPPVEVTLEGRQDEVVFSVANHGKAIAEDFLTRLFDPMTQGLDRDRSEDSIQSLGLGLYISQEIVRAYGGQISVVSADERTVFSVVLPR